MTIYTQKQYDRMREELVDLMIEFYANADKGEVLDMLERMFKGGFTGYDNVPNEELPGALRSLCIDPDTEIDYD